MIARHDVLRSCQALLRVACFTALAVFSLIPLRAAESGGSVSGTVSNNQTGNLLQGAKVEIPSLGLTTLVDATGRYVLAGVPAGSHEVVVSYIGRSGTDVSGQTFRHGERVAEGERGVWERALGPGKYAFNTYAGNVVLVPTTNFVLHWVTGRSESHRYDESLKSIDLVTKDAYEPSLPLSVVVHIDYQRAPSVIQRFGDVKKLITQSIDPMLSAYFRDVAHKKTMLELLHDRDAIL